MRLEAFISHLLYEHDCVIVPGFGGLVANYRGARLNSISHVVKPPSKHVGFNRHLTHNDGLLAGHMAQTLGIGYHEAMAQIEASVSEAMHVLHQKERISWKGIGLFFKDRNGQLQFIPEDQENFLLESYGLTAIQLHPIERKQELDTPLTTAAEKLEEKGRTIWPWWKVAAAVALPIAVAGSLWWGAQKGSHFQIAELNPFRSFRLETPYYPSESVLEEIPLEVETTSSFEKWLSSNPEMKEVRYNFISDQADEEGLKVNLEAAAVSTATSKSSMVKTEVMRYQLIGGAFAVKENAEQFLNDLRAKGYPAIDAGKKGNLFLIAYGAYATEQEARNAMQSIKQSGVSSVWLKR
jgi:hypothetical protein